MRVWPSTAYYLDFFSLPVSSVAAGDAFSSGIATPQLIGDGKKIPSVEEISVKWAKITDLKGAKEYGQLNDMILLDLLSALEGKKDMKEVKR